MLFLGLKVLDLHFSIKGCATNKLPLEIKAPLKTLLNIKLSVFYIIVYLRRKPVYMYVLNCIDRMFFALSDDGKLIIIGTLEISAPRCALSK